MGMIKSILRCMEVHTVFLSLEIFGMEWGGVRIEDGQALPDFSNTRRCFRETEINPVIVGNGKDEG